MKSRTAYQALALATSVILITFGAVVAWRSIERLYTAYLFAQGRIPTDDFTQAHVNLGLEVSAWAIVLGTTLAVTFLLRYWHGRND